MFVKEAPKVWNSLNGLICVYKPANTSIEKVRKTLMTKICQELNEMKCRPPVERVVIEGNPLERLVVNVEPSFADHPLVVGPRYQQSDLICSWSNHLGYNSSGVLLFGLQQGTKLAKRIRENYPARAYHVKGVFGIATDNCYRDGKPVERTTYHHIKASHFSRILAAMQAAHQKKMFELSGIDIQCQTAYELASRGLIRPQNSKTPILYGIKCLSFEPPSFMLEIQCVNEYEMYFKTLLHEIGLKLNSSAHCTSIQCIRHSYFGLESALLQKHWTLQNIVTNLEECKQILSEHNQLLNQTSGCRAVTKERHNFY